jgi:hypothetical protein
MRSSWRQAPWDLRPDLFQLNTCSLSPLQLLLALSSAFILRSEFRRTHEYILLSLIRGSPNLGARSPYLYAPGTWCPSYTPRHWVPFPSPSTTRRATVEVIRTRFHTLGGQSVITWSKFEADRIKTTALNSSSTFWFRIHFRACMNWSSRVLYYDWRSVGQSVLEKMPIWGFWPDFYYSQTVASLLMQGSLSLSDERMRLSFTVAAGTGQHSHSRVRVPWDSQPYFTVSDSKLPFSPPLTTSTYSTPAPHGISNIHYFV